jgi:hypothetical protein
LEEEETGIEGLEEEDTAHQGLGGGGDRMSLNKAAPSALLKRLITFNLDFLLV